MCTALTFGKNGSCFGRNLDLERGYGEQVVITPRNFSLPFRFLPPLKHHYAMIGMAAVANNYPLYFEATNEKGLSIAGLNFPGNAHYQPHTPGRRNVAPFELIPWLLGTCADLGQVSEELGKLNVVNCSFSPELPVSALHWIIASGGESLVLECTKEGMKVHKNPFGVLTNNPTFDFHRLNVSHYMSVHSGGAENRLSDRLPLENFSLGLGAMGLPGDFSSASRFVKTVFVRENSLCADTEEARVNQFFHILQSVAMPKGCVRVPSGEFEYTRYSCCCTADTLRYYYTTYDNMSLRSHCLWDADPEGTALTLFPM